MQPLALDLGSVAKDVVAGQLAPGDWARVAKECGVSALDLPLAWLLDLDPHTAGVLLRQEMEKRGVVIAAVRDERVCHLTSGSNLSSSVPLWPARWGQSCATLAASGWGVRTVVLRTPATDSMGLFNKVAVNLTRARHIAAEWGIGVAISNEATQSYAGLLHDVPGLWLALDADQLPAGQNERLRALDAVLGQTRVIRVCADGTEEDTRALCAWRNLLDAARFEGFISVRYTGEGDPYSGAGTAITLLRGSDGTPRPPAPGRTTPPHQRGR